MSKVLFGRTGDSVVVPAGRYLVGDLCYVDAGSGQSGKEWSAFCDQREEAGWRDVHVGTLAGRPAAVFSTAHGDGEYEDGEGRFYPVDSGSIGIMLWDEGCEAFGVPDGCHLVEFEEPQTCGVNGGVIAIGPILIDTDPSPEEDEEPEEDQPEWEDEPEPPSPR